MRKIFGVLLKNQLGFTLPEIMIGSAIMAGVALAGATIFRNQARSQARVENDQILNTYHAALSKTFNDVHNCNATFKNYYNAPQIPAASTTFMTNPGAVLLCQTNCNPEFDAGGVSASLTPFIRPGDWIDRVAGTSRQIWRLTNVTFENTLTSTGTLRLRFTYTINPRIETRSVVKDLNVNLRFTPGPPSSFKECFNDQESSINNLQNDICKSMFPAGVATTGELVEWDDATQTCMLKGSPGTPLKTCTASGMMVEGIRSDGTVHCKPLSQGFDPTPVLNSSGCTANSKVKLVWVGSKVRVTCVP